MKKFNTGSDDASDAKRLSRRAFLTTGVTAGVGGVALAATGAVAAEPADAIEWHHEVDVLVVGSGPTGLAAALAARDAGASVLVVEKNFDIGGTAILSNGQVHLGGGNAMQKANGVDDTEEQVFIDFINRDHPLTRHNDRELVRRFADENLATFDFLVENGVVFDSLIGPVRASSVPRQPVTREWPNPQEVVAPGARGSGLTRPMEVSARQKGVGFLLQHKMVKIHRDAESGEVIGITAEQVDRWFQSTFQSVNIRARKGVVLGTGGHASNVEFRRIFDPRLTEEYQAHGESWAPRNAEGTLAALEIGAGLWGTANQTNNGDGQIEKGSRIGKRYNSGPNVTVNSSFFFRERATGLVVSDWQNAIMVKENGKRFYNEAVPGRNYDYYAAAMEWTGDPNKLNGGGPIWAIFDADAVEREKWTVEPPFVDYAGYFATGETLEELAANIVNPYQWRPMPGSTLRETVERYNSFVDSGTDEDFQKPTPLYKIAKPPFYAAWATPANHDSYAGLRINTDAEVLDYAGKAIPGLYAGGETTGGFGLHGVARGLVFGRIAGQQAAARG